MIDQTDICMFMRCKSFATLHTVVLWMPEDIVTGRASWILTPDSD